MMSSPEFMIAWFQKVIGKKLVLVNALFHVLGSERGSSPQEISFQFDASEPGRLYCGSDGASICFSLSPIVGCELGEYGEQVVYCISSESCFSNVVGDRLISASSINSSAEEAIVGISLSFYKGCQLSVLNLGDELYVYGEVPEEIIISEGLEFISVS